MSSNEPALLGGCPATSRKIPSRKKVRIASWNLRYSAEAHSYRRLDYLATADWDIVALQEVSRKAWKILQDANIAEYSC